MLRSMDYGWIPAQAEEMRKSFPVDRRQKEGERKEGKVYWGQAVTVFSGLRNGEITVCKWDAASVQSIIYVVEF